MPIPTYSKDLPEIPEDIARKAYDVCKFFRERGHNVWAYHHLCSRDFVNSEVARVTKELTTFTPEEVEQFSKLISRSVEGPSQGYQTYDQWKQVCLEMTEKLESKGFCLYGEWRARLFYKK